MTARGLLTMCGHPIADEDVKAIHELHSWHCDEFFRAQRRLERAMRKRQFHKVPALKASMRIHERAYDVLSKALDDLPF